MKFSKILGIIVTLVVIIVVGIMTITGITKDNEVSFGDNYISIKGFYGIEIQKQDILNVEMTDVEPKVGMKINGMGIAGNRRGLYSTDEYGRARVYTYSSGNKFIIVETKKEYVIFNFKEDEKTEEFFDKLMLELKIE